VAGVASGLLYRAWGQTGRRRARRHGVTPLIRRAHHRRAAVRLVALEGWQEETETRIMRKRKKYCLGVVGEPTRHDYP